MKRILTTLFLLLAAMQYAGAQTDVIIGAGALNGTSSNGATGDPGPMYRSSNTSSFVYSMHHYLYTQAELTAAGIPANTLITKIAWAKDNNAASNANFLFQIWAKNSSLTTVQTAPQTLTALTTGSTQVYNSSSTSLSANIGFVEFTLSTPILYTGGALEITVNFDMSSGSSPWTTAGISWKKDNATGRTLSYCNSTPGTSLNNLRTVRPQIRLTYISATCSGTPNTTNISGITGTCSGSSFTLTATGASRGTGLSYKWQKRLSGTVAFTDIPGFTDTFLTTSQTNTTSEIWEYRFVTTCSGSGLSANSNIHTVTIVPPPAVTGITFTSAGNLFTFTGTGVQHAATYYWEYGDGTSGTSNVHNYAIGGLYNVKLVVGNACGTDTIIVPIMANIPCNSIEAGTLPLPDTLICQDEMIVLEPTGYLQGFDIVYQWQRRPLGTTAAFTDIPGETNATLALVADENMEYRMRATCTNNATTDYTNELPVSVKKKPSVATPTDITVRQFEDGVFTVSTVGDLSFRWQSSLNAVDYVFLSNNNIYTGVTTSTLTIKKAALSQTGQLFRCIISDASGCAFTDDTSGSATLIVLNTQSVKETGNGQTITVYPNPASYELFVISSDKTTEISEVIITDMAGRIVQQESVAIHNKGKVNISQLPAGKYTLRLNSPSGKAAGNFGFIKQ